MGKSKEIYVKAAATEVNKKDVESDYQKTMPKLIDKLVANCLAKAKSKGVVTKSNAKDAKGFQLAPTLKLLKNIGKGDELKIRAEVAVGIAEIEGGKILGKLTIVTEGATVLPPSPPPKKLDGEYEAAVEAAASGAMKKVMARVK